MDDREKSKKIVIVGAGPSGLAAGLVLSRAGYGVKIIEATDALGGLARTIKYKDFLFDVGPHRFFTKNQEVLDLWKSFLGEDLLRVSRLTRILYGGKYFSYPIKPFEALRKLGFWSSIAVGLSYLKIKIFRLRRKPASFHEWVAGNFGEKLYQTFFKTYTEKVWGITCDEIAAEWAAQRIKNLSLLSLLKSAFFGNKDGKVKSLVEEFYFPRLGAGEMYEALAREIIKNGGEILYNLELARINHENGKIISVEARHGGEAQTFFADDFIVSSPMTELVGLFSPVPPAPVSASRGKLFFRSHICANFILKKADIFPDQWIYIHDASVKLARVANYRNFSREMAPPGKCGITAEYFVFSSDELWKKSDEEIKSLAAMELEKIGLVKEEEIEDGFVVRSEYAYPAYYTGYEQHFVKVKEFLGGFGNLYMIGRGGMYKYNNQDHAILSGLLAAKNILGESNNLWMINTDEEYHEEER